MNYYSLLVMILLTVFSPLISICSGKGFAPVRIEGDSFETQGEIIEGKPVTGQGVKVSIKRSRQGTGDMIHRYTVKIQAGDSWEHGTASGRTVWIDGRGSSQFMISLPAQTADVENTRVLVIGKTREQTTKELQAIVTGGLGGYAEEQIKYSITKLAEKASEFAFGVPTSYIELGDPFEEIGSADMVVLKCDLEGPDASKRFDKIDEIFISFDIVYKKPGKHYLSLIPDIRATGNLVDPSLPLRGSIGGYYLIEYRQELILTSHNVDTRVTPKWLTRPVRIRMREPWADRTLYLGKVNVEGRSIMVITTLDGNISDNPHQLSEALRVQYIYRLSFSGTNESLRLQELDQQMRDLEATLDTPYMSDTKHFLKDESTRTLVEATELSLRGETSSDKMLTKEAALSAVEAFRKNPLRYAKGVYYLLAQATLSNLQKAKADISEDVKEENFAFSNAAKIEFNLAIGLIMTQYAKTLLSRSYPQQGVTGDLVSQFPRIPDSSLEKLIELSTVSLESKSMVNASWLGKRIGWVLTDIYPAFDYLHKMRDDLEQFIYEKSSYYRDVIEPTINFWCEYTSTAETKNMALSIPAYQPERTVVAMGDKPQDIVRWYFELVKTHGAVEEAFLSPEDYTRLTGHPEIVQFRHGMIESAKNEMMQVDWYIDSIQFKNIDPMRLFRNYKISWRSNGGIDKIRMGLVEGQVMDGPNQGDTVHLLVSEIHDSEPVAVTRTALVLCDISEAIREPQGRGWPEKIWFLLIKSKRGWRIFDIDDTELPP